MITWRQFERGVCILLGVVHFSLGFVTWIGGEQRFPAPAYTPLLNLSCGVVWPYGIAWMMGGLIMIVCKSNWRLLGISIVVLISNLWAVMFGIASFKSETAPYTPIVAYGGYGLLNALLAVLIIFHWWWGRRDRTV